MKWARLRRRKFRDCSKTGRVTRLANYLGCPGSIPQVCGFHASIHFVLKVFTVSSVIEDRHAPFPNLNPLDIHSIIVRYENLGSKATQPIQSALAKRLSLGRIRVLLSCLMT